MQYSAQQLQNIYGAAFGKIFRHFVLPAAAFLSLKILLSNLSVAMFLVLGLASCGHTSGANTRADAQLPRFPGSAPLRVAVSPNYPPIIWKESDRLAGLEFDFANALGQALQRDVEFVELPWHSIFDALNNKTVDVIMSGVSVTEARTAQFSFIRPYTTIGQMAIIRTSDAARLGQPGAISSKNVRVGYEKETTGETFVVSHLPGFKVGYLSAEAGIQALIAGQVDYFVHDAPTVWRLANAKSHEWQSLLLGLYRPLTKEPLAWVVQKENAKLKSQIEVVYDQWRSDGTLNAIVTKWLPTKIITE